MLCDVFDSRPVAARRHVEVMQSPNKEHRNPRPQILRSCYRNSRQCVLKAVHQAFCLLNLYPPLGTILVCAKLHLQQKRLLFIFSCIFSYLIRHSSKPLDFGLKISIEYSKDIFGQIYSAIAKFID